MSPCLFVRPLKVLSSQNIPVLPLTDFTLLVVWWNINLPLSSLPQKFRRRVQESTQVLRELEISLRTNHIGWVTAGLCEACAALNVLDLVILESGGRKSLAFQTPGDADAITATTIPHSSLCSVLILHRKAMWRWRIDESIDCSVRPTHGQPLEEGKHAFLSAQLHTSAFAILFLSGYNRRCCEMIMQQIKNRIQFSPVIPGSPG